MPRLKGQRKPIKSDELKIGKIKKDIKAERSGNRRAWIQEKSVEIARSLGTPAIKESWNIYRENAR